MMIHRMAFLAVSLFFSPVVLSHAQDPLGAQASDGASVGASADSARDKLFLRTAADSNLAEIEFGKLAVQKGNTDEVKVYGQKMIDDHTAMAAKMEIMMEKYGVRSPKIMAKEDQAEYDQLVVLSGEEFDKKYITASLKMHIHDLHAYRMEIQSSGDRELKASEGQAMEMIVEHAKQIYAMAKSRGIAVPKRPHPQGKND